MVVNMPTWTGYEVLIVAAAVDSGSAVLYRKDMQDGLKVGAALVASGVWLGVVVSPSASKTDGKATGADLGLTLRFAF